MFRSFIHRGFASAAPAAKPASPYRGTVYFTMTLSLGVVLFDYVYLKYYHRPPQGKLVEDAFNQFELADVIPVSASTSLFRFKAFVPSAHLDITPVPSHVVVKLDDCQIAREYTPISYRPGGFDLLVKKYENGTVSKYIHSLQPGEFLTARGPVLTFPYSENMADEIGMIAGGTGITPFYQLIKQIIKNPYEKTRMKLVYCNKNEDEILLKNELELIQKAHPDRLEIVYSVDKPLSSKSWTGFVDIMKHEKVLKQQLPDPTNPRTLVLVCGPDGMVNHVAGPRLASNNQGPLLGLLKKMGFTERNVFKF